MPCAASFTDMFIVARRKGQRILIGDEIEVVVTELSRSTVKLGIVAPKPYFIMRGELRDSVEQANRDALNAQIHTQQQAGSSAGAQTFDAETHLASVRTFLRPTVNDVTPSAVNTATSEPALGPR